MCVGLTILKSLNKTDVDQNVTLSKVGQGPFKQTPVVRKTKINWQSTEVKKRLAKYKTNINEKLPYVYGKVVFLCVEQSQKNYKKQTTFSRQHLIQNHI